MHLIGIYANELDMEAIFSANKFFHTKRAQSLHGNNQDNQDILQNNSFEK